MKIVVLWVAAMGLTCLSAEPPPAKRVTNRPTTKQPSLKAVLDAVLSSQAASSAFYGVHVVDLDTGADVYKTNESRFFVPASNTKLYSSAFALGTLGLEHQFKTEVRSTATLVDGVLKGDLRLVGGGDPNLSGRVLPYDPEAEPGNPLGPLEWLADQVVTAGIRQIEGDIVGDDRLYVYEPFPVGWGLGDTVTEYGAPVSALTVNDNTFEMTFAPGSAAGEPARVTLKPAAEYFEIDNQMITVETGIGFPEVSREPGSRTIRLRGTILRTSAPRTRGFAVDDPAHYAAFLFRELLERRGVRIEGKIRADHRHAGEPHEAPAGQVFATHTSRPLRLAAQIVNKESQNLHAELMLLAAGTASGGNGSRRDAVKKLEAFLTSAGVPPKSYELYDGSGLSRMGLIKPEATIALLRYLWSKFDHDLVLNMLPVGGRDGTLRNRFESREGAENIRAKTGSLSHVAALSGFALRKKGGVYAFSIMVNNFGGPSADTRTVVDNIALALVER
ncbi:MAG TPA: D-alanyl-D-alanine carboxypeptidase/D-alanyl-D-alanine-endopeptidase [Bryobacteraceae bacterium]|nr:D-alanyl-D-alanine carboxypeptidase/D-alanyl-D-alanine-endopeptidase [Bryobacteraceae bacterium]